MSIFNFWKKKQEIPVKKVVLRPDPHKEITLTSLDELDTLLNNRYYRNIRIILDYDAMSEEDFVRLYYIINRNDEKGVTCNYVHSDSCPLTKMKLVYDIELGNMVLTQNIYLFINNLPTYFYTVLWERVKDPLFGNIPKVFSPSRISKYFIPLADLQGPVETVFVEDHDIIIDHLIYDVIVYSSDMDVTQVSAGDITIPGSKESFRYIFRSADWLVVQEKSTGRNVLYVYGDENYSSQWWDKYSGMKAHENINKS